MAFRQSVGYRILLMVMSLVCLAAAGYFVWQAMKPTPSLDDIYKQAESSYSQGEEAYKGGSFAFAVQKFDDARKQVEQVLASIEKQREQAKAAGKDLPKADELKVLEAKAHYLRARALRDTHHAQAAANDKPIQETLDTTTGEKYRSFKPIADPKIRDEATASLYHAAGVLTKDPVVLKEAVRLDLMSPPFDWERLSKNLSAMLELDPKDARAHYWLARFDFFQPQKGDRGWQDTDPAKRSLERVERSLRGVRRAKELGTQPPWRLMDLEARALDWLADNAPKKKTNQPNKADEELRTLILHPNDGAIAIIRKAEKLELPTSYDLLGVLTAHRMAIKLAGRDAGKPGGDRKTLIAALRQFLDSVPKIRESSFGKLAPADVTMGLLEAISLAQPPPNVPTNTEWAEVLDKYLDATNETKAQNATRPALVALIKDVLSKEIRRSTDRRDDDRVKNLRKRQADLIDSALKDSESSKISRAELNDLHARALELKLLDGVASEEMTPHLKVLASEPAATRPAIANFAEGIIAWRQGKILSARENFEAALRYRDSVDFLFGAQWLLYQVYTATGQTGLALNALRDTESYFAQPDKFTALDRLALADAPISPEDFLAHLAIANIEASSLNIRKYLKENQDAIPPSEISATAEKLTEAALKKLKTPSAADLYLRLAYFRLRQMQQRKDLADESIKTLRRDYGDSPAVLAAEASWLAIPRALSTETPKPSPEGIKEADLLVEEFCATHPRDIAAKLFRVEWLARTGRIDRAIALLKESSNLEQGIGAELGRLIAHLRGYPLVAASARGIVDSQPAGTELVSVLIQAIADQHREPGTLVNPFRLGESRGRQALRSAAKELADGRFEEAARGFVETSSVASLTSAMREGLWLTIRSCAAIDPARAHNLCVALAADQPDEPTLYFGVAFAALLKRDFGLPRDTWERTKSMAAALNRWEQFAKKTGADPADLAMTRAGFWGAADRPATARDEAARASAYDAYNTSAVVFMARDALGAGTEDGLKVAQKYWNKAVAVDPDDLGARCLDAEIKARRGEWASAIRIAQDVVRDHPRSSEAHGTLVKIGLAKKDGDDVIAWIRNWMKAIPCDIFAAQLAIENSLRRGHADAARTAADDFIAGCGAEVTRRLEELKPAPEGVAFENWQRYARIVLDRANGEAWLGVIAAFRQAGQADTAKARLQAAIEKNPDSEVLLMLHADMAVSAERWQDAADIYRRILAKKPRHEGAAAAAIRLTPQLKDADGAFRIIKDYGSAGDLDALDAQAFSLDVLLAIGEVHEYFTASKQRSALRLVMVDSLSRFPNDPRVQLYAGQLYYAMGDGMRAADCLKRALRLARADEGTDISAEERKKVLQAAQQSLDRLREEPKTGNSDT